MALGLCCQWLVIKNGKPKNVLVSRSLQLGRYKRGEYSHDRIKQTYLDNLRNLQELLPTIINSGIRSLRVSSSIFPLFDLVNREIAENPETCSLLAHIGQLAMNSGVRITTHPGQFTVISSDDPDVVTRSVRELEYHAWMFDKMGLPQTPYYSINIHGGKSNRCSQLIAGIDRLSPSARSRLTLENCEFAYSVKDLELVAQKTNIPICFDSHHHRFNNGGLLGKDAMELAINTWPDDIKPMTHLSNSKPEYLNNAPTTKLRQHSDYLYEIPNYQQEALNSGLIDIEIEAKMKNLAIFKAVDELGIHLS